MSNWRVGQIRMDIARNTALYIPGLWTPPAGNGNYASTPDSAANSIVGDIDIRVDVAMDDWTPVGFEFGGTWAAKANGVGNRSWLFDMGGGDGLWRFNYYPSTAPDGTGVFSNASPGFADGARRWVRVTRRSSTGVIRFYTSADGLTWTQLGSDRVTPAETMYDSTAPVTLGDYAQPPDYIGVDPIKGKIFRAEIRDGIGGTVVNSFDATVIAPTGTRSPNTVSAGGPWTIVGSDWDWVAA